MKPLSIGLPWLETLLTVASLSLVLQISWPSLENWWNRPLAGRQVSAQFECKSRSIGYLIYLPEDYSSEVKGGWPLLLYLHGSGARGRDLEKVRRTGPPAVVESGKPLPMIVISPQCPEGAQWQPELLVKLIDHISQTFKIDPKKVYVTGYSMGGIGTWELATAYPDRFAAAAPVCGGGNESKADRLATLPIWAFHGENDSTIPLEASQKMVDAVRLEGGNAKLTVYPDRGHAICELTYENPDLYSWFMQQGR